MRLAALIAGLAVAVALAAPPLASAHAALIASDPADGAKLQTGPTQVSATFNEPLQAAFAAMTVVGPDGNLWSTSDPQVDGAVIKVAVSSLGPVGRYTVNYRVTSEDGHAVTGSWWFELTVRGSGTPGAPVAAQAETGGGIPAWPFAVVSVAVVAIAAGWALRHTRRG